MAPHQIVLVLWILFEVALLSGYRGLGHGFEMFDESADIYYESLEKAA